MNDFQGTSGENAEASSSGSSIYRDALAVLSSSNEEFESTTSVLDSAQDDNKMLAEARRMSSILFKSPLDEKRILQAKKMSQTAIQNAFSAAAEKDRNDETMAQTSSASSPAVNINLSRTKEIEARKMSTTSIRSAFSMAAFDNRSATVAEPRRGVFSRILNFFRCTSCCGRRN
ncbi:uncharacterized protein LOC134271620 isoform X1 [Saccostrea cucullata]|uniref:uncharacterized protein LOC134271620 isoform X1 n=1 Tax=Saccostrea cuccullata TaxID=36930 RepID=UPI002ED5FE06